MDKSRLSQYRALKKEQPMIEKKLDKLYKQKASIPDVMGKVQKSSAEFPYTMGYMPVEIVEPKEAQRIGKQIDINEARLAGVKADILEIERFIQGIENSVDRQIIELVYLEGKKYKEVGEIVGYTKGRISQKISEILKD